MPEQSYTVKQISVSIEKFRSGVAGVTVWVHLRGGVTAAAYTASWPSGAPTPHKLLELEAAVLDELQTLVLTECGVQGVLLAGDGPEL